jgi:hypothetical protein
VRVERCAVRAYFGTAGDAATDALPFERSRVTGRAAREAAGTRRTGAINRMADVNRDRRGNGIPSPPCLQSIQIMTGRAATPGQ